MKKTKGITLIALVITIIVLLLLAGVALNSLIGSDSIIKNVDEAVGKYNNSVEDEKKPMNDIIVYIDGWIQEENTVKKGNYILKIGDYVNYDETNSGEISGLTDVDWRVLGAKNGELLLISSEDVESLTLTGFEGIKNGIKQLDKICEKYGNGKYSAGSRSINVEDVNSVTGYDVNKGFYNSVDNTYYIYGYGEPYEYGSVTTFGSGYPYYDESISEWKQLQSGETREFESDYYAYYPTTLTSKSTDPERGLSTTSVEYKMLFEKLDGTNAKYWLASTFTRSFGTAGGYANFGLRMVDEQEVQRAYLMTHTTEQPETSGVRAVVTITQFVNVEYDEENDKWNLF